MNPGEFRWLIDILELVEVEIGVYEWRQKKRIWSKMEHLTTNCVYSKNGISARSARFTIESRHEITLHNALALAPPGTGHFFLADINREKPGFYVLSTAVIAPVTCEAERTKTVTGALNRPETEKLQPLIFPGYLTEKYLRQTQDAPMSYSETRYVLITPKAIGIQTGELVDIGGALYETVIPHVLDPWKNEYEILERKDN